MDLPDKTQGKSWEGAEVVDRDGERLGTCVGVFADIETDLTEWLQVDVAGHRPTFVPALHATELGERVQVRFAKAQVLSAPETGEDVQLSQREEEQLYSHYGVAATTSESDSVLPVDVDAAAPAAASGAGTAALPAMDPDAATTPAPRLRRVPRTDTAAPAPTTASGAPTQSGDASAVAPLAGIAGLVLGVWFVLRALERRAQRRRSPAVKAERLRRQVGSGSAKAAKQAGKQWAATAGTRKKVADAASSASDAAARQGRAARGTLAAASAAAAKAASKAGSDVSSSVDDASKKAHKARKARERKRARRSSAGRLAAVSGLATKAATDAGSSASGVAEKARKHRSSGPLSGLTRSTRRASGQAAGSVSAAPKKAQQGTRSLGKRVRKTKRSFARTFWRLVTLGAAGGGYVMGAKAGRERYDELTVVAGNVAEHPQVRSVTESLTDPEKRSQGLAAVQDRLPGQGGSSQQG